MKKVIEILEKELDEIHLLRITSNERWRNSDLQDRSAFNDMMYYDAQIFLLDRLITKFENEN